MALKLKSIRQRNKAFQEKGGIPFHWWTNWHRGNLSETGGSLRCWTFIFTRPHNYVPMKGEEHWTWKIYVWDSEDEKWITQLTFTEDENNIILGYEIDLHENILLLKKKNTTEQFEYVKVYELLTQELLSQCRMPAGFPPPKDFKWAMSFLNGDYRVGPANNLMMNDKKGNWIQLVLPRGNTYHGYINILSTPPLITEVNYGNWQGIIINLDEKGPKDFIPHYRFIVILQDNDIVVMRKDYHPNTSDKENELPLPGRGKTLETRLYSTAMNVRPMLPRDIDRKSIFIKDGTLYIDDLITIPTDKLINYN